MIFGELVRSGRQKAGWSRRQLGRAVGASGTAIGKIECGGWEPRAGLCGRLCKVLGIREDPWVGAVMGGRIPRRVPHGEAEVIVALLREEGKGIVAEVRELKMGVPEWEV